MRTPVSLVKAVRRRWTDGRAVTASYFGLLRTEWLNLAKPQTSLYPITLANGLSIVARPRTTDWNTVRDVFKYGYHLPEWPLAPNATIVDLGSNVGYSLLDFSQRYPSANLIGVELDGGNIEVARVNTRDRSVSILHAAIAAVDGVVSYDSSRNADAFSISSRSPQSDQDIQVRALSLNSLISEAGLDSVDYMKIDIEGAEFDIFAADVDSSWLDKVNQLNIEVHGWVWLEEAEAENELRRIIGILQLHGFIAELSTRHPSAIVAVRTKGDSTAS
jgi:FkbM family methyltransferase